MTIATRRRPWPSAVFFVQQFFVSQGQICDRVSRDAQKDGRRVRGQVHKEGATQQEPDEGNRSRDRRAEGVRVERSRRQTARGLRDRHGDGAGARVGRWRRTPAHTRRRTVPRRGNLCGKYSLLTTERPFYP